MNTRNKMNSVVSFQSLSFLGKSIVNKVTDVLSTFLDLTISVGADIEKVRCHKFIVAMVSDVIQSESVMKDEIIFTNIKKDILQEIIDYCYTQMIGPFVNKSHVSHNCLILL